MNPFDDEETIYMVFELRAHGKEQIIKAEYHETVHWTELVDDVVKQIESAWGYSFDLPKELGIYHKGKKNDE